VSEEEQDEVRGFTDHDEPELPNTSLDDRVAELESLVEQLSAQIRHPNPLPPVFMGQQTNSDGRWGEIIASGGSIAIQGTTGVDGRGCTSSANTYAQLYALSEAQFFVVESQDSTDSNFTVIPNGAFLVYLTQVGGVDGDDGSTTTAAFPTWTYDCYADAAKTIKWGSAVSVLFHRLLKTKVTKATHGLAQWNGSTLLLLTTDEYPDQGDCS
jgi:hypothetical protein